MQDAEQWPNTMELLDARIREQRAIQEVEDAAPLAETASSDDQLVMFEGEAAPWAELTLQDRKAYLAGGYPF